MFITTKKHNQIIEDKDEIANDIINNYRSKILKLEKELEDARDLKSILDKFSSLTINGSILSSVDSTIRWEFPDTVLQYTDDILGGKVIKQEGTKCILIDKDGNVKIGLTKQKSDKGYSYKLVRE